MTLAGADDWDKRFPVSEGLRPGIAMLQDLCSSFSSQLVVQPNANLSPEGEAATAADKPSLAGKLNPQVQLLRSSPQLSARRNASLRNLTVLARASSPLLRPTELGSVLGILDVAEPPLTAGSVVGAMETPAQFLEWYGQVEGQLAAGQDAEAHAYASQLRERVAQCSQMLGCVADIQQLLSEMEAGYQRICLQTSGVEAACASLGAQRSRLDRVATEIGDQLAVYNWLGPITRLLHAPGDRVCEDREFLPSLDRAEEAIRFIERRMEAKDSELYLMRFAQCRMRALSLIKMHALRAFKALGSIDAKGPAAYVHFRAAAVALGPLMRALQQRATQPTERQVLADVQAAYFSTRRAWLRPHIQARLRAIAAEHEAEEKAAGLLETRVGALRDWCAFLMAACADEARLYRDFFGDDEAKDGLLRAFLDSAMTLFHEQVRPLVIHESDVAVLAGLSLTLLTYRRMAPQSTESEEGSEGEEGSESEEDDEDGLDAFYAVVAHVLQDTQHRLAYKAQSYIRAHISGYRIAAPDADAMARWVHVCLRLRIAGPAQLSALLDEGDSGLSAEDAECLRWVYPPIESCRWLVAQIDGCLDYEVQCGLVDEARTACKQNLLSIGARFVRDSSIKSENPLTEADAELIAHLFATHNLGAIDHYPDSS